MRHLLLKRAGTLLAAIGTLLLPASAGEPFRVMEYNVENFFPFLFLWKDPDFFPHPLWTDFS